MSTDNLSPEQLKQSYKMFYDAVVKQLDNIEVYPLEQQDAMVFILAMNEFQDAPWKDGEGLWQIINANKGHGVQLAAAYENICFMILATANEIILFASKDPVKLKANFTGENGDALMPQVSEALDHMIAGWKAA